MIKKVELFNLNKYARTNGKKIIGQIPAKDGSTINVLSTGRYYIEQLTTKNGEVVNKIGQGFPVNRFLETLVIVTKELQEKAAEGFNVALEFTNNLKKKNKNPFNANLKKGFNVKRYAKENNKKIIGMIPTKDGSTINVLSSGKYFIEQLTTKDGIVTNKVGQGFPVNRFFETLGIITKQLNKVAKEGFSVEDEFTKGLAKRGGKASEKYQKTLAQ